MIVLEFLAAYIAAGFVLMTLEGLGWLKPTLGNFLRPIFYPFLLLVWLPGLRDATVFYINWLKSVR